jgi:hypothetical protein
MGLPQSRLQEEATDRDLGIFAAEAPTQSGWSLIDEPVYKSPKARCRSAPGRGRSGLKSLTTDELGRL